MRLHLNLDEQVPRASLPARRVSTPSDSQA